MKGPHTELGFTRFSEFIRRSTKAHLSAINAGKSTRLLLRYALGCLFLGLLVSIQAHAELPVSIKQSLLQWAQTGSAEASSEAILRVLDLTGGGGAAGEKAVADELRAAIQDAGKSFSGDFEAVVLGKLDAKRFDAVQAAIAEVVAKHGDGLDAVIRTGSSGLHQLKGGGAETSSGYRLLFSDDDISFVGKDSIAAAEELNRVLKRNGLSQLKVKGFDLGELKNLRRIDLTALNVMDPEKFLGAVGMGGIGVEMRNKGAVVMQRTATGLVPSTQPLEAFIEAKRGFMLAELLDEKAFKEAAKKYGALTMVSSVERQINVAHAGWDKLTDADKIKYVLRQREALLESGALTNIAEYGRGNVQAEIAWLKQLKSGGALGSADAALLSSMRMDNVKLAFQEIPSKLTPILQAAERNGKSLVANPEVRKMMDELTTGFALMRQGNMALSADEVLMRLKEVAGENKELYSVLYTAFQQGEDLVQEINHWVVGGGTRESFLAMLRDLPSKMEKASAAYARKVRMQGTAEESALVEIEKLFKTAEGEKFFMQMTRSPAARKVLMGAMAVAGGGALVNTLYTSWERGTVHEDLSDAAFAVIDFVPAGMGVKRALTEGLDPQTVLLFAKDGLYLTPAWPLAMGVDVLRTTVDIGAAVSDQTITKHEALVDLLTYNGKFDETGEHPKLTSLLLPGDRRIERADIRNFLLKTKYVVVRTQNKSLDLRINDLSAVSNLVLEQSYVARDPVIEQLRRAAEVQLADIHKHEAWDELASGNPFSAAALAVAGWSGAFDLVCNRSPKKWCLLYTHLAKESVEKRREFLAGNAMVPRLIAMAEDQHAKLGASQQLEPKLTQLQGTLVAMRGGPLGVSLVNEVKIRADALAAKENNAQAKALKRGEYWLEAFQNYQSITAATGLGNRDIKQTIAQRTGFTGVQILQFPWTGDWKQDTARAARSKQGFSADMRLLTTDIARIKGSAPQPSDAIDKQAFDLLGSVAFPGRAGLDASDQGEHAADSSYVTQYATALEKVKLLYGQSSDFQAQIRAGATLVLTPSSLVLGEASDAALQIRDAGLQKLWASRSLRLTWTAKPAGTIRMAGTDDRIKFTPARPEPTVLSVQVERLGQPGGPGSASATLTVQADVRVPADFLRLTLSSKTAAPGDVLGAEAAIPEAFLGSGYDFSYRWSCNNCQVSESTRATTKVTAPKSGNATVTVELMVRAGGQLSSLGNSRAAFAVTEKATDVGTKPGDKKDPLPTDPTTKVPVTDSDRVTEEERRRAEEDRLYKERAEKEQLEQEAAAFRAKVEKDRADAERKSREKPYVWSCVPWFCKCVLQSEWKPNDRCPGVGQGGGMCGSASTGQGKSCGSYAPPIDPKELENAALSVSVDAARSAIKPGENTLILALAKGGKGPYRYTWSQNVSGSSDAVRFAETKTGTHTVSVEVTDSKGAKASANTRVGVSNIIASIDGLKAEAAYASKLLLRAIINSQTPDSGAYQIVWQASLPGVAFDPPEGPTTQMTLGRMGPIKIWMQIRERSSGAGADAVVESPQQDVRVVAPMFSWVFDPEKGKGKLGQEIRATLTATPAIHPDLIRFEWAVPASADRREYSKNANAVGFTPKDVKPTALAVDPRVPFYGDPIGDSLTADYEATGYTVTVKGPQPRQVVQMWQCDTQLGRASSCGMKTMENQFAVDQQILFSAGVEPAPEKAVNYAWSLTPEGCTLGAIAGTQTSISCHATGSYTVTAQASVDKIVVGSASGSVTVSISQNDVNSANKAKEAYEKLQKAKELVGQGRLDEGLALADEASKLDAKNAETTALVNKWRAERDSVQGYLRAMDAHIGQQKLDDAQHDLSEAQKLHPKYAPVTDAEKRLKEALRKAEVEKKRLEELKKALEERLARARDLVAQGKLDEGIALADEALRLDPRHAEAQGLTSRWKAEKQMVLQQLEQVRQRVAANQLAEAQNALTQAQKLHPRYAPVLEMEKYLKAAQTQDALKKEVAGKVAKAKDLVLQGKLDEGIGLIDEALKVDPRHAEGNQLAARWKTERQSVAKQVDSIRKLLPANNIVDAEKELAGALKLHPKYGPVVESQKLINDAKKRIAEQQNVERTQKEEQARGLLREASALEQRGDMAGALTKYQESMKVAPTGSAQQNIARLEVQFGQAKQLWDEGKAAFAANNLSGSLAKMKESLRVWPGDREREAYVAQLEQGVRAQQAAQAEAQRLRAQGEVLQQQNQLPAAIAKYRESLKLVPDAKLEQHIQTLERQVQAAQQQAQIQLQARNLRAEGEALQQQNQLPAAIVKYRESLKLVPDARLEQHIQTLEHQVQVEQQRQAQIQMQARNLRAEGEALQQQNQLPAAIAKYRESLKLVPDAKLEQHIQTLERQLQAQAQVQAQAQAQAKNLRAQGEMLQQQNRLRDAIAKYRESIAIWPDDALQAHIQKLEQILASAPVTSPVPVPVPTPAPVIARAGTGSWEYVGIGDCPGNDIEGGGPGEVPNPKVCDSGHLGLAAVCWDTHTPRVLSPSSCTVKRVTVENCTGGANPGRMYRCTVSQAGMDPTGVWRHHPEATWTISRTAAGGWFAQESGLGNASGPGNWTPGGSFRIDYVTRDGTIKGYYDVRFSPDGRSATGTVRELNGPQRSGDSQWSRLTGVSPSPIPSPATAAKPGFYPVDLTPYGGKKEAPTIVSDILMDRSSWIRLKHHGEDGHASPKMRLNVAVPSVSPVTSIALNGNLDHAHLVPQGTTITKMTVVANEGSASFDIQAGVHMSEWNGPNKHQVAPTGGGSSYTPVFKLPRPMTVTAIRFDYVEVSTSYDHEGSAPGFCLRGITLVGPGLSPTGSAAPLPATGHAEGGQPSDVLFDNGNIGGVSNQPTRPTAFTLDRPRVVTLIRNYHWNDGRGTPSPGTIALRDGAGHVYGPWPTLGSPGQGGVPNANWTAKPQVQIPAGSYTVIDSSPATWAQNSGSNGAGMTHVEGH